jgi:hypothetical protein
MLQKRLLPKGALLILLLTCIPGTMKAGDDKGSGDRCKGLPNFSALKGALDAATATETSGLNNQMWGTIVDRDGVVCAVAFSGVNRGAQWPGSRVIAAQKANTANAFSLDFTSNSGWNITRSDRIRRWATGRLRRWRPFAQAPIQFRSQEL